MGSGSPWRGSRDIHRRDSCAVVVKAWWPVRYRWGVVALGVVAGDIEMGRGSPRRVSREIEEEIEGEIEEEIE